MTNDDKRAWSRRDMLGSCAAFGSLAALTAASKLEARAGDTPDAAADPGAPAPVQAAPETRTRRVAQALLQTREQFEPVRALVLEQGIEPAFVFQVRHHDACE